MHRAIRFSVRFFVVVAIAAALPALFSSDAPSSGPYLSVLSDLSAPSALAAPPGCNNKACGQAPMGLKFRCFDSAGTNCKEVKGGQDCAVSTC